ncbi:MAG: sigma 54-interacting transcriptional regulator [Spirochaetes bacterium]|nr:sigma 54-interacting transcriptional regulator [Spirochaetota bacterium]
MKAKSYDKLKLLEEILSAINAAESTDAILDYLIDRVVSLTKSTSGSIVLVNSETGVLDIKASRGLEEKTVHETKLKIGEGVTGHVVKTGRSLMINNVRDNPHYIRIRKDLKSELAVPLMDNKNVIGVISVDSNKLDAYTEEHLDLFETIASFAAQTLIKANLIDDLKNRIEDQDMLIAVSALLEEEADFNLIFQKIMTALSARMHVLRGMIIIRDPDEKLRVRTAFKLSDEAMRRGEYDIGEGIIGSVYKTGKSLSIEDISKNNSFLNRMKIRRGREKNSFFAVPIRYDAPAGLTDKTIGVLSFEKQFISKSDHKATLKLLSIIASLIANRTFRHIAAIREKEKLVRQNNALREKLKEKNGVLFIGKSQVIIDILNTASLIADTDATVLLTGETGTGKEVLAQFIHQKSNRREKPFVSINCAAIPEHLIESELFGHKKGSFTGAIADKKGKFELAHEGTLFLDEIGELSMPLQSKILRVLQEKVIDPVGSEESKKVDVRIIAATNRNLKERLDSHEFREDLYYRLHVIHMHLPALRERPDDIDLFIEHFLSRYNAKYGKSVEGVTPQCRNAFLAYRWPGNVRELENTIERAVILARVPIIDITAIPVSITSNAAVPPDDRRFEQSVLAEISSLPPGTIYSHIEHAVDRILLEHALVMSDNKQANAAELLGLHRNTFREKLKTLGIRKT